RPTGPTPPPPARGGPPPAERRPATPPAAQRSGAAPSEQRPAAPTEQRYGGNGQPAQRQAESRFQDPHASQYPTQSLPQYQARPAEPRAQERSGEPRAQEPRSREPRFSGTAQHPGWQAAERAGRPAVDTRTSGGLPKRDPMANLVPGGFEARPTEIPRSANGVRSFLTEFQRGVSTGRDNRARPDRPPEPGSAPYPSSHSNRSTGES
ncbi:MAG TPA: hypothetical protein VGN37_22055, partial [Actinocatenispora sp.]